MPLACAVIRSVREGPELHAQKPGLQQAMSGSELLSALIGQCRSAQIVPKCPGLTAADNDATHKNAGIKAPTSALTLRLELMYRRTGIGLPKRRYAYAVPSFTSKKNREDSMLEPV